MTEESFPLICQHYITSFLYSEQGKNNLLINMEYRIRKAPIDINRLYLKGTAIAYYNKKLNYVICSDFDKPNYCMLTGNNLFPQFSICEYIATYRNEFFYCFFGYRELKLFEREFSKFSTGRKSIAYNKEFKKLLNKMQSVSEVESRKEKDVYGKSQTHRYLQWYFLIEQNLETVSNFKYCILYFDRDIMWRNN